MMTIILLAVFVCILLEMILIKWNVLGILACLAIVAWIVLGILKKRPKWVSAIVIVVVLIGLFSFVFENRESNVLDYGNDMAKVKQYIEEEKTEEALELLESIEEDYGQREATLLSKMICHCIDGDYEEALAVAEVYPQKTSKDYYSIMEQIYTGLGEEGQENLNNLYLEAANQWPSWLEMQWEAGLVQIKKKEYSSARSYFERAYYLDYDSGMSTYLLGMTSFYMGDYTLCLQYYNEALEKGVSDEVREAIVNQVALVQEGE